MKFDFYIYELKEDTKMYDSLVIKANKPNEFIIVGEEKVGDTLDCFKVQQVENDTLCLIGGLLIDEAAYLISKTDLQIKTWQYGTEISEFDIPKQYLSLDTIENIKRLNDC